MKTANFLSLASLIAIGLFAQVGCSTPSVGDLGDNASADSNGDDDDDDDDSTPSKTSKSSKSSSSSSNTASDVTPTSPTNTAGTTTPTGGDACTTCLSANAKAVNFDSCVIKCQDEQCETACLNSSGCNNDAACQSTLQQCASACGEGDPGTDPGTGTTPTTGGDDPCLSCVGGTNSPAGRYITCSDNCQDEQCDDNCFNSACGGQEDACDSTLQGCEQQCFGGQ